MENGQKVTRYLERAGFDQDSAAIYLALQKKSPQSISELSRSSEVERTRVYRLLGKLKTTGLVKEQVAHKRSLYRAGPLGDLETYLLDIEDEARSLRLELPEVEKLSAVRELVSEATQVKMYKGREGIKQMQWNLLKSTSMIYSIMHKPMFDITGDEFFMRWAERWNKSELVVRLLYDRAFLEESNKWHKKNPGYAVRGHDSRMLSRAVYKIEYCLDVYDDTVAFYNWSGGEIFGMEVVNREIANSHRYLAESLWVMSVGPDQDIGNKNHTP